MQPHQFSIICLAQRLRTFWQMWNCKHLILLVYDKVNACRRQIAVDIFAFGKSQLELATISQASQFGGGALFYFPNFSRQVQSEVDRVIRDIRRYLIRPLGLEAVLRVRTSRGITLDNFHGNLFVRAQVLVPSSCN